MTLSLVVSIENRTETEVNKEEGGLDSSGKRRF